MTKRKSHIQDPVSRKVKRGKTGKLVLLGKQIDTYQSKQDRQRHASKELEIAQQRKKQHKAEERAKVPYTLCQRLLLIGEGNFSYARALLACRQNHQQSICNCSTVRDGVASNITATCYDDEKTVQYKYSDAQPHIEAVTSAGGSVLYGVDATQLHSHPQFAEPMRLKLSHQDDTATHVDSAAIDDQLSSIQSQIDEVNTVLHHRQYDRLIWLFPHTGSGEKDTAKNNAEHQQLLAAYLQSVVTSRVVKAGCRKQEQLSKDEKRKQKAQDKHDDPSLLTDIPNGGEIHIVLKAGEPYDSWDLKAVAKRVGGIRFRGRTTWHPSLYTPHGYRHRKTAGSFDNASNSAHDDEASGFLSGGCKMYVFQRVETQQDRRDSRRAEALVEERELLQEKVELLKPIAKQ